MNQLDTSPPGGDFDHSGGRVGQPLGVPTFATSSGHPHEEAPRRDPRRVVVTGAGRGLGLELVRQLLAVGTDAVGWCRPPVPEALRAVMLEYGRDPLAAVAVDVSDAVAVQRATEVTSALTGESVDALINNAGIGHLPGRRERAEGPLPELQPADLLQVYAVNVIGPILATQALAPLLERHGGLVANITSDLGWVNGSVEPGSYGYAMSKAALNMLTRKLALELHPTGITVVAVHPGSVRTRMGGPMATTEPAAAAAQMLKLLDRLPQDASGRAFDLNRNVLPW